MKKTQIIIFHRPYNSTLADPLASVDTTSNFNYRLAQNPNETISSTFQNIVRPSSSGQGLELDLFDNVSIPLTYTIMDVKEPEKRKTSWSKTISIPGTANNNRIFSHVYEIGQDGWTTIGGKSVYTGFNPNLRKEVIVLNDGIQVLKGNMQMKSIKKDKDGNIQYEVALNGDLTSLFYDVGTAKLNDLDFSEWDHLWTKESIKNSWEGLCTKSGADYQAVQIVSSKKVSKFSMDPSTGRLLVQTSIAHGLVVDDYVKVIPNMSYAPVSAINSNIPQSSLYTIYGDFIVTDVISTTKFVVNHTYPISLPSTGFTPATTDPWGSYICKTSASGRGYVYPMISWGDEFDYNSFPVTSFVPAFYIKELFDKIMAETNSSYKSDFLDSQFFKRLILTQKRPTFDLNPGEVTSRKFWVGTTQSYTTAPSFDGVCHWVYPNTTNVATASFTKIFPTSVANRVPFKAETSTNGLTYSVNFYDKGVTDNDPFGNWNGDQLKWDVKDSGEYKLSINVKLTAWCDMNGYDYDGGTGTASFNPSTYNPLYYPGYSYGSAPGPLGNYQCGLQAQVSIKRRRAGVVSDIGSTTYPFQMNKTSYWTPTNPNWKSFGRYQPSSWENVPLSIDSSSTYFAKGDEVWVELKYYVQAKPGSQLYAVSPVRNTSVSFYELYDPPGGDDPIERTDIVGEWFVRLEAASYIFNDPSPKSSEGSIIEANSFLPKDMTCKDFLLSILKTFNLHIEPDRQIERLYYIEPRSDYYYDGSNGTSDYVDWSDRLDADSVELIPMGELIAKFYTFENKEESDYWNKKFKDDRGRAYSSYTKEIENDFLKNEVKVSIPLGTTIMINNPEGSDVVMPSILQKDTNGSAKPVSNSLPRMLIWGGIRPYTAQRGGSNILLQNPAYPSSTVGWEMLSSINVAGAIGSTSSIFTYYPYAGTVDNPVDPVYDINWYNMSAGDFVYYDHARWTNENLYNKYWKGFIDEVSDPASKVVIANFNLSPKDIYELDFRKIYVVDGNYLRLQKVVDFDPVVTGLTKCEFLKLKAPSKFTRRSLVVDSSGNSEIEAGAVVSVFHPIVSTTYELAPIKKRPEYGYSNTTPGTNISNNSTVTTSGLSNFVGSGGKNIKINGNENAIGNNSNNVHISSGNGNYIAGNVTNVNVIGTDKKYISESDVTYINGIRYKNGIPVSKSNVINGGIDAAVVRQSDSTTINVIHAGEDVVISGGSSTYENVINPGMDMILPDVLELGILTTANPNPRTNQSGGFISTGINIATQSMVEIVRQKSLYKS